MQPMEQQCAPVKRRVRAASKSAYCSRQGFKQVSEVGCAVADKIGWQCSQFEKSQMQVYQSNECFYLCDKIDSQTRQKIEMLRERNGPSDWLEE
eukprot:148050-Pleurochrysis_carterae.AAC.1